MLRGRKDKKRQESSRKRLDKLAKGAFVKVRSMAWDVWIHAWSHSLLGGGYGHEGFHDCIAMVFCWIIHGDGCFWRLGFSLNEGFPRVYLVSQFCGYIVYSLACGFNFIFILIYDGLCGNCYIPCCQVSLQVVSEPSFGLVMGSNLPGAYPTRVSTWYARRGGDCWVMQRAPRPTGG